MNSTLKTFQLWLFGLPLVVILAGCNEEENEAEVAIRGDASHAAREATQRREDEMSLAEAELRIQELQAQNDKIRAEAQADQAANSRFEIEENSANELEAERIRQEGLNTRSSQEASAQRSSSRNNLLAQTLGATINSTPRLIDALSDEDDTAVEVEKIRRDARIAEAEAQKDAATSDRRLQRMSKQLSDELEKAYENQRNLPSAGALAWLKENEDDKDELKRGIEYYRNEDDISETVYQEYIKRINRGEDPREINADFGRRMQQARTATEQVHTAQEALFNGNPEDVVKNLNEANELINQSKVAQVGPPPEKDEEGAEDEDQNEAPAGGEGGSGSMVSENYSQFLCSGDSGSKPGKCLGDEDDGFDIGEVVTRIKIYAERKNRLLQLEDDNQNKENWLNELNNDIETEKNNIIRSFDNANFSNQQMATRAHNTKLLLKDTFDKLKSDDKNALSQLSNLGSFDQLIDEHSMDVSGLKPVKSGENIAGVLLNDPIDPSGQHSMRRQLAADGFRDEFHPTFDNKRGPDKSCNRFEVGVCT